MSTPTHLAGSAAANAWEALFRAQVAVLRELSADNIWRELSIKEYDVLFTLSRAEGRGMRLKDLNTEVLMPQPSLSRLVERLEARGLVTRRTVPDDLRGTWVELTDAGADAQRSTGRRHVESIERLVGSALSPDELDALEMLCTRLRAHAVSSSADSLVTTASHLEDRS